MTAQDTAPTTTELKTPTSADLARVFTTERPPRPSAWAASTTFGWRALLKIKHVPEQLFDVTLFPIMMTLMFTYLFGGALAGSPTDYLQFFLPGILVVSIVMITMYTGLSVNTDIEKGVFDRFRTLPIWRPAPMVGYLLGDGFRYLIASVVIVTMGLILGYRPDGGVTGVLAGVAVLLLFCFALSWIWTMFGLMLRSEKSVMGVSMMLIMPLSFLSSAYVDPSTMPNWLEAFVNVNPITFAVDSVRALMSGDWPGTDLLWLAILSAGLIAVFGAATMRLYNRK
ncbi:ABC transporter permease [Aeromicrobium piscarium]|uniref:Transport permease protein n=1 Tax=Aeromicrobium piscarium TaxID=2590901 RepID=A0A554SDJ6_9ACTN|nr:ABC transporter permease [Aeromicrobium piscarium]TSD64421.1 ABC transporter permease [Aeromicrobium piscarium]